MTYQDKPSEKQQIALRKFKVPEPEIQKMRFQDASNRLHTLIEQSKARQASKESGSSTSNPNSTGKGSAGGDTLYHNNPSENSFQSPSVSVEEIVSKRLDKAIVLVKKRIPNAEEFADYLNMISEISHQLFSEEAMRKIQSDKERNMGKMK